MGEWGPDWTAHGCPRPQPAECRRVPNPPLATRVVTIAAYDNLTTAREDVAGEASELASLYRGISSHPQPVRGELQATLVEYTHHVIEQAWPLQQQGIVPTGAVTIVDRFFEFNDFLRGDRPRHHGGHDRGRLSEGHPTASKTATGSRWSRQRLTFRSAIVSTEMYRLA